MRQAALLVLLLLLLPGWMTAFAHAATLSAGSITVEYSPNDENLARESLRMVLGAIDEFKRHLPVGDAPIRVIICRTHGEFASYAGRFALPGVGGVAVAEENLVAVKAPDIQRPGSDYIGILRHEVIHLLLARNTNVAAMPRWFNEGLTMILSKENRLADRFTVALNHLRGATLPYPQLEFVMEVDAGQGRLGDAYAQSLSMTQFLMKRLGETGFWRMVRNLDDHSFQQALIAESGMNVVEFYQAWKRSLWKIALVFSLVSGFSAFQLMILLAALAYWRIRRRNKAVLERWESEDEDDDLILFPHDLEGREEPYPWEEDERER